MNHQEINENLKLKIREIEEHKIILKSYPYKIFLEISEKCNLKCIMCDNESYSSEKKDFPVDLFHRILPLLKTAEEVNFFLIGEPTLSENLIRYLNETKEYSFLPKIFINGTVLNEDILRTFDERGVFVNISIEAATRKIYEMIRVGASFEHFESNTRKLVEKYNHRKNDRFHLRFSSSIAIDHISEVLNIIEFANKMGIRDIFIAAIDMWLVSNRHLVCDSKKAVYYFKKGKELADKYRIRFSFPAKIGDFVIEDNNNWKDFPLPIDKYSNEYVEAYNTNPITKDCGYPWIQTVIRANGDVLSCCQRKHYMGNLNENSFDEIWNGDKYQTIRAQSNFQYCFGTKCNMLCYSVWPYQNQISRG